MSLSQRSRISIFIGSTALAAAIFGAGVYASAATKPATAPVKKQVVTGPVAVYWMDTTTSSGMSGMMGGGKPSMSSIMSGMMGGGGNVSHSLDMELGSSQTTTTELAADHLPPPALKAGNALPLYWKDVKVVDKPVEDTPDKPHDYEPPKGKILIFWGCGEHAPKNQPVVIDLSKLTDPAARMAMMKQMVPSTNITLDTVREPTASAWKSYGEWPNKKSTKSFGGDASLIGPHTIKGNYSPEIDFTINPGQDFLAPIEVTNNQKSASGSVPLAWKAIPASKGFIATAVGGGQDTVVMWTSAEIQTAWMGFAPQYLTANDVDRLLVKKALLPGNTTTCTVPAEVGSAAQSLIYGITAYGADANFSYPPRPADPNTPWNIAWETKVRYRSSTGGILGQDMAGMMGGHADNESSSATSDDGNKDDGKKKKKSSMFGEMLKAGAGQLIR